MVWNPYTPLVGRAGRLYICLLASAIVAGIAAADRLDGADYSLSLFYLLPVGGTTWYVGRRIGVFFSLASTVAVAFERAEFTAERLYSAPVVWQTLVHVSFMLSFVWLLDRLRANLERQQNFASTDPLTGLMNRRAFIERLNFVLRLASRKRSPVSLAYIDLDNFKQVNDLQGHEAGDRMLRSVAGAFTRSIRSSDVVARLGGDEFAILLPDTNSDQAQHFGGKLWHALAAAPAGDSEPVSCSVGCITFSSPPPDAESVIKAGDKLMYRSKRSGKNKITFEEWRR